MSKIKRKNFNILFNIFCNVCNFSMTYLPFRGFCMKNYVLRCRYYLLDLNVFFFFYKIKKNNDYRIKINELFVVVNMSERGMEI